MEIITPHRIKSREVLITDLERVKNDSIGMAELCNKPIGRKSGGLAIAHCQITDNDPLRFFVTKNCDIYVNPKIVKSFGKKTRRLEGCLSFASLRDITVNRFDQIEASCFDKDLNFVGTFSLVGTLARVFQHEIDHFNGINIYGIKLL